MSHYIKRRRFSRSSSHRKSMLVNLAKSLLTNKIIKTTLPKAKDLRGFVERLVTLSKVDSVARRRLIFSRISDKTVTKLLFEKYSTKYYDRPGGYTRILKCGYRNGDSAPMAYIQFV